ncbi:hypothetical protein F4778DRAFT_294055 [Xylariomycetidae sp. FL2044]|nr:hypothetical protein F4778DRAFT_294055 [Xylariomycetidae sp. FL2044]
MDGDSQSPDPWKYFPFRLGDSEHLEHYEPGGFHPVHLGDVYANDDDYGRYKVVHKLGWGGFLHRLSGPPGTPQRAGGSVALKLKLVAAHVRGPFRHRHRQPLQPRRVLPSVRRGQAWFWVNGPNGRHLGISGVPGPGAQPGHAPPPLCCVW